jgi:hypothetical protein
VEAQPAADVVTTPPVRRGRRPGTKVAAAAVPAPVAVPAPTDVAPEPEHSTAAGAQIALVVAQLRGQVAAGRLRGRFVKQCDRLAALVSQLESAASKLGKKDTKRVAQALGALSAAADAAVNGKKLSDKKQQNLYEKIKESRKDLDAISGK